MQKRIVMAAPKANQRKKAMYSRLARVDGLRVASAAGTTPAWWQFKQSGACRQNSLTSSFDMSDQMECEDPWEGQASG